MLVNQPTNKMNTETALATIAQTKQPPIKPPLRKNEILRATAQAMYQESKAAHEKARDLYNQKLQERDKAIIKEARKQLRTASVSVNDWHGHYEVKFTVKVPKTGFDYLNAEVEKVAIPRLKSADDFYKQLREAAFGDNERWAVLLEDKAIAAKLVESGKKLLGV